MDRAYRWLTGQQTLPPSRDLITLPPQHASQFRHRNA